MIAWPSIMIKNACTNPRSRPTPSTKLGVKHAARETAAGLNLGISPWRAGVASTSAMQKTLASPTCQHSSSMPPLSDGSRNRSTSVGHAV